ncbi:hypothetical protein D8674_008346 [Pyrus ussuriensis x Pyrus communis]|uniref:Retrotransposon gag domain-containing protein n=1 Tax=Pyrus ussuriensis x Pyrus communis TaxID=2448454 RepID=A0A5N5HVG1_9ROSA|nr:hypothetical protein D8674_008346 [Pyrus ussuriensis x Pyrus communis]
MVMSWINSSVHPTVLAALIGKTSSHSSWTTLRERYASQSTCRLLQLRSELMNTHRGDSSISDFLDKINCLVDTLSLSGAPISDSDLVAVILNNVGPAYESTVSSAQARKEAISYGALEALLLSAERRQKMHCSIIAETGPTALAATRGGHGGSHGNHGHGTFSSSSRGGRGSSSTLRNQYRPANPNRHPGAQFRAVHDGVLGALPSSGRIHYQICRRPGHSAIDCYNRLNMAYEGRVPAPKLQAFVAAAPLSSASTPAVQNWLFDSGTNVHITNDPGQVSNPRPYNGTDHVNRVVGGTGCSHEEDPFPRPE